MNQTCFQLGSDAGCGFATANREGATLRMRKPNIWFQQIEVQQHTIDDNNGTWRVAIYCNSYVPFILFIYLTFFLPNLWVTHWVCWFFCSWVTIQSTDCMSHSCPHIPANITVMKLCTCTTGLPCRDHVLNQLVMTRLITSSMHSRR